MPVTDYSYGPGTYNTTQLQAEIVAAGGGPATVSAIYGNATNPGVYATAIVVEYPSALSGGDKTLLDALVAAHVAATLAVPYTGVIPIFGGRLTADPSLFPITNNDVTAATSLAYVPYQTNVATAFDGTNWFVEQLTASGLSIKSTDTQTGTMVSGQFTITGLTSTAQLAIGMLVTGTSVGALAHISTIDSATQVTVSVANSGSTTNAVTFKLAASTNYDVFLAYNNGKPQLMWSQVWSSDTARTNGINMGVNGVWLNTAPISSGYANIAANTGVYLGTIRTVAVGQLEDSLLHRYVFNYYNRVDRALFVTDTTSSWNYTTATWRQVRATTSNKVEMVIGINDELVSAIANEASFNASNAQCATGVGIDSTTINSAQQYGSWAISQGCQLTSFYWGYPGIGYHALNWLEISQAVGTTTWQGTGSAALACGLRAIVRG